MLSFSFLEKSQNYTILKSQNISLGRKNPGISASFLQRIITSSFRATTRKRIQFVLFPLKCSFFAAVFGTSLRTVDVPEEGSSEILYDELVE